MAVIAEADSGPQALDMVFSALADATRRHVVARLGQGPATVSELAGPHGMSLPGFMKHLRVLEEAGLVVRNKEGRSVRCELAVKPMQEAAMWLSHYEQFWNGRLDALGRFLYHEEETNPWPRAPRDEVKTAPKHVPNSGSPAPTRSRPKKSGAPGPTRKR